MAELYSLLPVRIMYSNQLPDRRPSTAPTTGGMMDMAATTTGTSVMPPSRGGSSEVATPIAPRLQRVVLDLDTQQLRRASSARTSFSRSLNQAGQKLVQQQQQQQQQQQVLSSIQSTLLPATGQTLSDALRASLRQHSHVADLNSNASMKGSPLLLPIAESGSFQGPGIGRRVGHRKPASKLNAHDMLQGQGLPGMLQLHESSPSTSPAWQPWMRCGMCLGLGGSGVNEP
jgi:hypothetical protein